MLFTCVGNQNMIHLWDKDTSEITSREVDANLEGAGGHLADEAEGDDDARLWCHPRLRRAKGNTTSGQYFEPQPTDDFSGFGKASIPLGVRLIPFRANRTWGEGAPRCQATQICRALQVRKRTWGAGAVHWLRS